MHPSAFSRNIDEILTAAEHTLSDRGVYHYRDPHYAQFIHSSRQREDTEERCNALADAVRSGSPHRRSRDVSPYSRKEGALVVCDENYRYKHTPLHQNSTVSLSTVELSRQLNVCLREIKDLRTELQTERDARNKLTYSHLSHFKEEIGVEVKLTEHRLQCKMKDIEESLLGRFHGFEAGRLADRKHTEDVLRAVKVYDSTHFQLSEQIKDEVDDLRRKIDATVAATQAMRLEAQQAIEKEKVWLNGRLDTEISRFSDLYRQQQSLLTDTKASVAREVVGVGKQIDVLVQDAWAVHIKGTHKHMEDRMREFSNLFEKNERRVLDEAERITRFMREIKQDVGDHHVAYSNKLSSLESLVPLLNSRVDRSERKMDSVVEANNRMLSQVDILKEGSDRASVQGQRSMERAQSIEDSMQHRDQRIATLESQISVVAGIDRWRQDLDGIRHSQQKIEGQVENMKLLSEKDDRAMESFRRIVEDVEEKIIEADKKVTRTLSRVDQTDQRVLSLTSRVSKLEDISDLTSVKTESIMTNAESALERVAAAESRFKLHSERVESNIKEIQVRFNNVESKVEDSVDKVSKADLCTSTGRKYWERLDKRVNKAETAIADILDNIRDAKDDVDTSVKEIKILNKKLDGVQLRIKDMNHTLALSCVKESPTALLEENMQDVIASSRQLASLRGTEDILNVEQRLQSSIDEVSSRTQSQIQAMKETIRAISTQLKAMESSMECPLPESPQTVALVGTLTGRVEEVERRLSTQEVQLSDKYSSAVRRPEMIEAIKAEISIIEHALQSMRDTNALRRSGNEAVGHDSGAGARDQLYTDDVYKSPLSTEQNAPRSNVTRNDISTISSNMSPGDIKHHIRESPTTLSRKDTGIASPACISNNQISSYKSMSKDDIPLLGSSHTTKLNSNQSLKSFEYNHSNEAHFDRNISDRITDAYDDSKPKALTNVADDEMNTSVASSKSVGGNDGPSLAGQPTEVQTETFFDDYMNKFTSDTSARDVAGYDVGGRDTFGGSKDGNTSDSKPALFGRRGVPGDNNSKGLMEVSDLGDVPWLVSDSNNNSNAVSPNNPTFTSQSMRSAEDGAATLTPVAKAVAAIAAADDFDSWDDDSDNTNNNSNESINDNIPDVMTPLPSQGGSESKTKVPGTYGAMVADVPRTADPPIASDKPKLFTSSQSRGIHGALYDGSDSSDSDDIELPFGTETSYRSVAKNNNNINNKNVTTTRLTGDDDDFSPHNYTSQRASVLPHSSGENVTDNNPNSNSGTASHPMPTAYVPHPLKGNVKLSAGGFDDSDDNTDDDNESVDDETLANMMSLP